MPEIVPLKLVDVGSGAGELREFASGDVLPASMVPAPTLTKADVGLSNVDNTSDADKPISTATQSALNGKEAAISKSTGYAKWTGSAWTFTNSTFVDTTSTQSITGVKTLTAPVFTGSAQYSVLKAASEYNAGSSGTSLTVDFANGQKQYVTLTRDATLSFSFPGVGNYQLRVVQDATGSRTLAISGTAVYIGSATLPAIQTAANSETLLSIYYNGSKMYIGVSKVGA